MNIPAEGRPGLWLPSICPLTDPDALPSCIPQVLALEVSLLVSSVTHGTCHTPHGEARVMTRACTLTTEVSQENGDSSVLASPELETSLH